MAETQTVVKPRLELVYAGRVTLKGGKIGFQFYPILDESKKKLDRDNPRLYAKFKTAYLVVGGVHSVEHEPDAPGGTVYPGTIRYERMWTDEIEVGGWQANDQTIEGGGPPAVQGDQIGEILTRLHGMYLSLPHGVQRSAFLTLIINGVTRG